MLNGVGMRTAGLGLLGFTLLIAPGSASAAAPLLELSESVVAEGDAVRVTVQGEPGDFYAVGVSLGVTGLVLRGVALELGADAQVAASGQLDGQGRASFTFTPVFGGDGKIHLQGVTAPTAGFEAPAATPGKTVRNGMVWLHAVSGARVQQGPGEAPLPGTALTAARAGAGTATVASGSAGAPSLSFVGDPDTGLFSSGPNTVDIATGGVSRLTVGPSGDVTLTGNLALPASSATAGNMLKGGKLFLHNIGTSNTFVGEDAGNLTLTGSENTAVGKRALSSDTTGSFNTATGSSALASNTDGSSNTATGRNALSLNLTGGFNTATGQSALLRNTTGDNNTATGQTALAANTTGSGNTATGQDALAANTTGNDNTAVGRNALLNNTAQNNTALGAGALQDNIVGINNTAIGKTALQNNLGDDNTATGLQALRGNTDGNFGTAVGAGALQQNTTGNANTGIGHAALENSTTGGNNSAVGNDAMFHSVSGINNTAIGAEAMRGTLDPGQNLGSSNTAAGFRALQGITSAFGNVAVGREALQGHKDGSDNTAVGRQALKANVSGNNNIAVGVGAGATLITGDGNIYIGNAGLDPESNKIRIGTSQTATFVAGINGTTVGTSSPVLVNASGQLGTVVSSRRFKEDVQNMGEASDGLLRLRPVTFRYTAAHTPGSRPLQYGLIAEEVAEVYPELVVYSATGQVQSVQYHLVNAMLLNEVQKQHARIQAQQAQLQAQAAQLEALLTHLGRMSALDVDARPPLN